MAIVGIFVAFIQICARLSIARKPAVTGAGVTTIGIRASGVVVTTVRH